MSTEHQTPQREKRRLARYSIGMPVEVDVAAGQAEGVEIDFDLDPAFGAGQIEFQQPLENDTIIVGRHNTNEGCHRGGLARQRESLGGARPKFSGDGASGPSFCRFRRGCA